MCAQAQQPAHDQRHVGPEHPAVGVRLIDDDEAQVPQHPGPALVRAQQGGVNHVRVGEDEARMIADAGAGLGGGIAVVRRSLHVLELRDLPCQL